MKAAYRDYSYSSIVDKAEDSQLLGTVDDMILFLIDMKMCDSLKLLYGQIWALYLDIFQILNISVETVLFVLWFSWKVALVIKNPSKDDPGVVIKYSVAGRR